MNRCTTQDEHLLFLLSQLSPFAIVSFWHFPSVIQHLFQLYSYYFIDMYIQMNNCSWLFHLSPFAKNPAIMPFGIFSCSYSTQLSTKFILLINVKMPKIVGILTFISMINTTTSERLNARNFFICQYLSFYEHKFRAQLSWARKKFYNLGAWSIQG